MFIHQCTVFVPHVNLRNDLEYTTSLPSLSLKSTVHFLQRFSGTGGTAVAYDGNESSQPTVPTQDKEEWEVGENSALEVNVSLYQTSYNQGSSAQTSQKVRLVILL